MPAIKPPKNWLNSRTEPRYQSRPWRVLIVEANPIAKQGLVQALSCEPDFTVCAEAGNARKAMVSIAENKPDVVITSIVLPEIDGIEFTKEVVNCWPKLPVLFLSMHDESFYGERALRAGARGYLMKQNAPEKLPDALRRILNGKICVSAIIADKIRRGKKLKHVVSDFRTSNVKPCDGLARSTKPKKSPTRAVKCKTRGTGRGNSKGKLPTPLELVRIAMHGL